MGSDNMATVACTTRKPNDNAGRTATWFTSAPEYPSVWRASLFKVHAVPTPRQQLTENDFTSVPAGAGLGHRSIIRKTASYGNPSQ